MNEKREYKIVQLSEQIGSSEDKLNNLWNEGWELITTFYHPKPEHFAPNNPPEPKSSNPNFVIFKRLKT